MPGAVHVEGLRELRLSLGVLSKEVDAELRAGLAAAAEPVREDAETRAVDEITNIGHPWSRMRLGVTKTLVYVVPKQRGRRGRDDPAKRPNLAGLLQHKALEPALDAHEGEIAGHVEVALQHAVKRAGF